MAMLGFLVSSSLPAVLNISKLDALACGQSLEACLCVTNLPEVFLRTDPSKVWQTDFWRSSRGFT